MCLCSYSTIPAVLLNLSCILPGLAAGLYLSLVIRLTKRRAKQCILKNMSKAFWAIIIAIIVIFGGLVLLKGNKADAPASTTAAASSHTYGTGTAGVTLVEYGDFECSACGQYYPLVKQVKEKYSTQIIFQYRHLPLTSIHQNAMASARAAEAAGLQGKFWEMHDMLFENQAAWSGQGNVRGIFEGYAKRLGLDIEQYNADFASAKVNDTINADLREFKETGQERTTPTFLLDGKKIKPASLDEFSKLIDEAIQTKAGQGQQQQQP